MKPTYSFAYVLVLSCNIISATPPEQCSTVINDFLEATCPGSGAVNCYNDDSTTDFTSRDLIYMGAMKNFTDGQYECCYKYESRAPKTPRDDCDSNAPFYSIDQSHFTLGIDCNNYTSAATCGNAIKVDQSCNGDVDNPCSYTLCFKWNGMTATDKCCTSPGFYSIKNGNTDTFSCVRIPTCTCTDSPTEHPTQSPSKNPTESPSKDPSLPPTKYPTESPTRSPTKDPTKSPTKSPSKTPSKYPSKFPTENPSKQPSKYPTKSPTEYPSESPSKYPSKFPTKSPSKSPSKFPTGSPSKFPSKSPSKFPSKSPSKYPTQYPTKSPTKSPTKFPTTSPSKYPSKSPSKFPTGSPSKYPSKSPSKFPTKSPSKYPSKSPSKYPSKSPTKYPTKSPTKSPSKDPSKYPTKFPSKSPSKDPSKYPTKSPSKFPTESPSNNPSKFPTKSPTPTSCPNISPDNGPVDTCVDQGNCINVISTAKNDGDKYEICIQWNVDTNCRKNGCISYACTGPHANDKTDSIGWLPYTQLCRTVNCGNIAMFGIKDSSTCSGNWTYPINNITSNCYADIDSNEDPIDICDGASHGCTWEFTAPDCTDEANPAHVDKEIPNDNSMKQIDEYNHKYNYKRIAYCILAVIIALILVLIGVRKFWCYYKNKQKRGSYSLVVEMEKIQDVEPMETGSA